MIWPRSKYFALMNPKHFPLRTAWRVLHLQLEQLSKNATVACLAQLRQGKVKWQRLRASSIEPGLAIHKTHTRMQKKYLKNNKYI